MQKDKALDIENHPKAPKEGDNGGCQEWKIGYILFKKYKILVMKDEKVLEI